MCKGITFSGSSLLRRGELFRSLYSMDPMFPVAFLGEKGVFSRLFSPLFPSPIPHLGGIHFLLPWTILQGCLDFRSWCHEYNSGILQAVSSTSSLLRQHLAEEAGLAD